MAHPRPPEAGPAAFFLRLPDLVQACAELRGASRIVVGFSGGMDSTVLLHLLYQARLQGVLSAPLHALHVNHVMQPDADHWQEHCRQVCAILDIPFACTRLPVVPIAGESLEETARNARHSAFASVLQPGEVLALAQHRDDQVETVLFRLLRGSGAGGLAGMPHSRICGKGLLVRPLLQAGRAELLSFARAGQLRWIEDPSNEDSRFDRNFLRNTILPLLTGRWPGLAGAVERSARLSDEAASLLDELAGVDLAAAAGQTETQLRIEALLPLTDARQRNLLRYWLQTLCARKSWAAPTHQVLERIVTEVLPAGPDAEPLLTWGQGDAAVELRRHRNLLHVFAPLPALPDAMTWSTAQALALPEPLGALELHVSSNRGLPRDRLGEVQVRFRCGGEQVKPAGRPTRPLKKLLQEAGIPPWLRERIPLLYVGDELVAVADLLICEGWLTDAPEKACRIVWRHPDLDCGYPPHLLI
jgi:tRNA(Ile)-lysidine synthase